MLSQNLIRKQNFASSLASGFSKTKADKDPQGIKEMKLKSKKDKPFNPLVICGPPCAGKVTYTDLLMISYSLM